MSENGNVDWCEEDQWLSGRPLEVGHPGIHVSRGIWYLELHESCNFKDTQVFIWSVIEAEHLLTSSSSQDAIDTVTRPIRASKLQLENLRMLTHF